MKRVIVTLMAMLMLLVGQVDPAVAQARLDSIRTLLEQAPVQEKVYLHLDNTSYYKGDTIWYKSYVVRADSLTYSDMSRILYVELLSPDGLVVKRENIIVSPDGYSDGNFVLMDSLYSGYYEIRAYTRWMLNFCVTEHPYGRKDREYFYNKDMARDFFRKFGTVYSRVFPVYERPDSTGDYSQKYIVSRPKTRIEKELKEKLEVRFYPEGGHLIAGTRCAVAFEAVNEEGEHIDISGQVTTGDNSQTIRTEHQGRGQFYLTVPEGKDAEASFVYHGKNYYFDLPKAERTGCALHVETSPQATTADITLQGLHTNRDYGVAVLCRGVLKSFQTIRGNGCVTIEQSQLPTGVNDLLVFDETGNLLADRLFFINHHDYNLNPITVSGMQSEYQPFDSISLQFQAPPGTGPISISVRDGAHEDLTYDTGNIVTDLLLSSELKGFIAYPDYYFESDDDTHLRALDLLMMVQGWRRYDYNEITSNIPLRYQPEKTMTIEGAVYPVPSMIDIQPMEVRYWPQGIFGYSPDGQEGVVREEEDISDKVTGMNRYQATTPDGLVEEAQKGSIQVEEVGTALYVTDSENPTSAIDPYFGIDHKGLHKQVTVESELVFEDDIATIELPTDSLGRFSFSIPPYYGNAILFLKARKADLSDKKKQKRQNRMLDETAYPDFYVKRDLFYPVFADKYDFYQCHLPEIAEGTVFDDYTIADTARLSKMDQTLKDIQVKGRKHRGRHSIDYSKPAYVFDTYDLYNLVTDRGLSFGMYNAQQFPIQVSMALLGNYNSDRRMQVLARLNDQEFRPYIFYRNYDPGPVAPSGDTNSEWVVAAPFRSDTWVFDNVKLNRQNQIRLYTDFELRNEDKRVEMQTTVADVTLDYMLLPDDTKRYTYRDRRYILDGMYEPDDFYHPDYSQRPLPADLQDHRRTLYWNPNARPDEEGRFTATFYNNGKQTRLKVSTAGITTSGGI